MASTVYVNTLIHCESSQGNFNSRFFYHFHIWSQFSNKYSLGKCQCIFLPRKKCSKSASWNHLGNHLDYYSFLLNCPESYHNNIIPSESSTRQISLACCFSKVTQFSHLIFLFNIIWFILISFGYQTFKKAVFDIVQWPNCIKHLVWKSLIGILFNFVLSNTLHTRNTRVLQLSADHQGDCFTSCKNIISTFILFRSSQTVLVTFPYLPWYWSWVHVNDNVQPEGVKLSPLCPEKIGFLLVVPGITDSKWD